MLHAIPVLQVNALCPTIELTQKGEKRYDGDRICYNCRGCGLCLRRTPR